MRHRLFLFTLPAIALAAAPAEANHGKVGLWNVTSTVDVAVPVNPGAGKKQAPILMPTPPPMSVQMCMSREEVEANTPPHIDRAATGCDTKLVTQTADLMRATMVCKGRMKGTGQIEVIYKGAEHYSGSYSFNGTTGGRAMNMKTTFKGDWVKADCGKVKPYKLRTQ
ncbi:MAG: DUF3617 domain-containing protein [Alphaproteobacteria bacterium]|nr:DUF3617 domain-containing protein [Alphaproteobacteria bacterium]